MSRLAAALLLFAPAAYADDCWKAGPGAACESASGPGRCQPVACACALTWGAPGSSDFGPLRADVTSSGAPCCRRYALLADGGEAALPGDDACPPPESGCLVCAPEPGARALRLLGPWLLALAVPALVRRRR